MHGLLPSDQVELFFYDGWHGSRRSGFFRKHPKQADLHIRKYPKQADLHIPKKSRKTICEIFCSNTATFLWPLPEGCCHAGCPMHR